VFNDRAPALAKVIEDLVPAGWHNIGQYENNRVECDHGEAEGTAPADAGLEDGANGERGGPGHAFAQNLRRGHCELAVVTGHLISTGPRSRLGLPRDKQRTRAIDTATAA
jgi:hypothetical protein